MKKFIAFLMAFILCFSLCSCKQSGDNKDTTSKTQKETIIHKNENYKITLIDRSFTSGGNSDADPTLTMIIENTSEVDLEFIFKQVSINGFSVDVNHNKENEISSWPVIVNSGKKTKFYLAMITDTITDVKEIIDFEATLIVNEILEMSKYYNMSEKTQPFDEVAIKFE